jgi:5-methylthioadenosine/S-adenosylhomocysteine deaminase
VTALVYRGAHLLTQDPALGELVGDLLIVDGRIAAVGAGLDVPVEVPVVEAAGLVIIPGFVDTHRHMWETSLRGIASWQDYDTYFRVVRTEIGGLLTPEDAYAGDLLGMLGALEAGVTTVRDESHLQNSPEHTEAILQALVDGGGRAVFAYGWRPPLDADTWPKQDTSRERPTYIREVLRRGSSAGGGLVTFALMPRGPELSDMPVVRDDLRFARDLGLRSSMHIGGVQSSRRRGIATLASEGLLGPDLLFVHCCCTSDEELRMLADSGGSASVSPYIELAMPGIGPPATERLVAAGVRPSLSVDAEPSSPGDMFSVMRAALLARAATHVFTGAAPAVTLKQRDLLAFATIEGARASGLDHEIGSLTPGKAADVVVLDLRQPGIASAVDPVAAVVDQGHPGAVIDVLVAGRYVKKSGRMVDRALVDRAVSAAERSRDRLLAQRWQFHS